VTGYAQNGDVVEALDLFRRMPERNVVSWTAMIVAYSKHGCSQEALRLFYEMMLTGVRPDQFTFSSVLLACASLAAVEYGKEVHENIIKNGFQSDVFVGNALVDMYAKCGRIADAQKMFENMLERDLVSWNAMITGYAQNGQLNEALMLFRDMPERDVVSWNVMIATYAQNGYTDEAWNLFQKMPERNAVSWTAMIAQCAQDGQFVEAKSLFQEMPERDIISWNAMIAGYVQNGSFHEALHLFGQMQMTDMKPNTVTFVGIISACANMAGVEHGKKVHGDIIRNGFESDTTLGNSLIDMYAKCSSIKTARKVFDKMPERVVVSWNTMIGGYGMHGCGNEALQLFEQMQHSGLKPNHVTFLVVLFACSHAGLLDDGWRYFDLMSRHYQIEPLIEHYCCMVDLLGRAGFLDEAEDFINKMSVNPNAAIWRSLLGACTVHYNVELGERVADLLFESDPNNSAHYVLLSNMYALAGRWDDVEKVRALMKDRSVKKSPGCSWIEVRSKVHAFTVGDGTQP